MILSILITILVGAFIGWLAGILMKSTHGFWMSCLLGIVGSFLGLGLANVIGLYGSTLANLLIRVAGTCILIAIVRVIMGKRF